MDLELLGCKPHEAETEPSVSTSLGTRLQPISQTATHLIEYGRDNTESEKPTAGVGDNAIITKIAEPIQTMIVAAAGQPPKDTAQIKNELIRLDKPSDLRVILLMLHIPAIDC